MLAIDYRGFGLSTGSPTEQGLILDARAAVEWATQVAGVPPERIVLLGHSLGTAVATAAAEFYSCSTTRDSARGCSSDASGSSSSSTDGDQPGSGLEGRKPMEFASIILVAAFSSLPTMLSSYAIAGWLPVLRPLSYFPWLLKKVMGRIVDKWPSTDRLTRLTRETKREGRKLRLTLIHARNDWDIPYLEDDKLFKGAVRGLVEAELGMAVGVGNGAHDNGNGNEEGDGDGNVMDGSLGEEGQEVERCVQNLLQKEKGRRTVERWLDYYGKTVGEKDRAAVTIWEDEGVEIRQVLWPYGGKFHFPDLMIDGVCSGRLTNDDVVMQDITTSCFMRQCRWLS